MSGRARQLLTCNLIITETILREVSVAVRTHRALAIITITSITIIEQIKRDMAIEQKLEILGAREIFWQSRLNTLQPNFKTN